MNPLQTHIADNRLNEIEAMNSLQDAGIVSDLCIMADSVCDSDAKRAIEYLSEIGR